MEVFEELRPWLFAVAVVAVMVTRRIRAVLAGWMGIGVALLLGTWGFWLYRRGAELGIPGTKVTLAPWVFGLLIAAWIAAEGYNLNRAYRRARTRTE